MPASPKVQILDETTANQIAAGEVVERPAAAVKELVENALDAGARHITVELDEGGKYLIRVTDDGSGMDQEDAILALQRHATSKIRSADDLFHITTMGFRGEAPPSIASVSQFKMVTKTNDAGTEEHSGVEIVCNGGKMESVLEVGAPSGTSITIENLFFNVPARLKFLKTSATELNHSLELIQHLALSYPHVAFRLMHQGSEVFASSGNGSMLDVCVQVFGRDTARHLVPMDYQGGGARVTGFIGTPAALKGDRSAQHTFVNHRFVRNKAVTRALDEAYKSVQTIHGTKYAVAVIMIEIDPAQVDVNVSPTKTEVRFTREGDVYSSVYHAVKEGLMAGALVPSIAAKTNSTAPARGTEENPVLLNVPSRPAANTQRTPMPPLQPTFDDDLVEPASPKREILPSASRTEAERRAGFLPEDPELNNRDPFGESRDYSTPPAPAPIVTPEAPDEERTMGEDYRHHSLRSLRVLAQTRNMYILAQTENSLVLIDQHIAHERVLYEKLLAGAEGAGGGVPTQRLMLPFTLELSKREALVIQDRLADLAKAGFEMEPFGGDSFVVRSVPASIARKSLKAQDGPEATLRAIIDELVEKSSSRRMLLPAEEVLITASCKMAVKAGDPLSFEEMDALVADLLTSENPYTCPHGRPIIVELANTDLDRNLDGKSVPSGKVHDKITLVTAAAAVPIWWFVSPVKDVTEIAIVLGSYIFSGFWLSDDLDTNSISYKRWGALRWLWYPYQKLVPHRSWISHGIGVGPLIRVAYFILMLWLVARGVTWVLTQWGVPINREALLGNIWHQTLSWTMTNPSYALLGLAGLVLGGVTHSVADTVVSFAKKVW